MERRHYVRLQETGRVCGVPPETIRQWAKNDNAPLYESEGGDVIDRRDLRICLLRRELPVPPDIEQWPRVLIADDDPEMRRIADWLVHYAWHDAAVCTAGDGVSARQMLVEFRPDLFVTDLRMPGGDGVELCQFVRKDPLLVRTKILVITGYDDPQTREKLMREGADECLHKPFEPKDLREKAFRLLGP